MLWLFPGTSACGSRSDGGKDLNINQESNITISMNHKREVVDFWWLFHDIKLNFYIFLTVRCNLPVLELEVVRTLM